MLSFWREGSAVDCVLPVGVQEDRETPKVPMILIINASFGYSANRKVASAAPKPSLPLVRRTA